MATCGTIRDMNLCRMREYMLCNRKIRIADAARETGMSNPTAAKLIGDLVESGEMKEVGCCASTGGRCAMVYEVNPCYLSYLLMQMDGETLRYQVRDYLGDVLASGQFAAEDDFAGQMGTFLTEIKESHPNLRGACMGANAFVSDDCVQRYIKKSPLTHFDMHSLVDKTLGVTFFMENDMNAIALSCWQQLGLQSGCIVCLYKQGVGLVIDGKVWRGKRGLPGEMTLFRPLTAANRWSPQIDPSFYYAFTAGVYAVTLDPDLIIVYTPENEIPCDPLAIKKLLEMQLAPEYVPETRAASTRCHDYWQGLDIEMRASMGIA